MAATAGSRSSRCRAGRRRRGGGRRESQGRGDIGKLNPLASLFRIGTVAAGIRRIDASSAAVGAEPNGAVAKSTVVRLVIHANNAAVRKGLLGEGADGEIGSNQFIEVTVRVAAEGGIGCNVGLALSILGACLGTKGRRILLRYTAAGRRLLDNGAAEHGGCVARVHVADVAGIREIDAVAAKC